VGGFSGYRGSPVFSQRRPGARSRRDTKRSDWHQRVQPGRTSGDQRRTPRIISFEDSLRDSRPRIVWRQPWDSRMKTLYHYCPSTTFHSLVSSRSIWLSSLLQSNDSMEGKLVAKMIARFASDDHLDRSTTDTLLEAVGLVESVIDGLGLCLSEDGDLLSQWRGYADDGRGVAIGFSRDYLEWLVAESRSDKSKSGLNLYKVIYEPDAQSEALRSTYSKVRELINEGAFQPMGRRGLLDGRTDKEIELDDQVIDAKYRRVSVACLGFFNKLFLLKANAFREEREWRLISYLVQLTTDSCLYRAQPNRVIPYRAFELLGLDRFPISEVILGPKHVTPLPVVRSFLEFHGFDVAKVRQSDVTYR